MEFLNEIGAVQWIFLGLGVFLIFPVLWETVKDYIPSWDEIKPVPKPKVPVNVNPANLTRIVRQWEALMDSCEERRLRDACSKLDEVFPLLINAREDGVQTDDE